MDRRDNYFKPHGGLDYVPLPGEDRDPPRTKSADSGTRNGMPAPGGYRHGATDAHANARFEAHMAMLRARFPANYAQDEPDSGQRKMDEDA